MTLSGNATAVPDGPPLLTMARCGSVLVVTVLHAAAADLVWQHRQTLVEIHSCLSLRLLLLNHRSAEATQLQWFAPVPVDRPITRRR